MDLLSFGLGADYGTRLSRVPLVQDSEAMVAFNVS